MPPVRPAQARPSPRSPYRTVGYAAAVGLAVIGAWTLFSYAPALSTSDADQLPAGARTTSVTRDQFEEEYELAWRFDGDAGNTAVEAVWYHSLLTEALNAYAERSLVQAETQYALQDREAGQAAILITLEHAEGLDQALDLGSRARLTDERGTTYELLRWQPFSATAGTGRVVSGLLWFAKPPAEASPGTLTLTLDRIPGNVRPTTFQWNVKLLGGSV